MADSSPQTENGFTSLANELLEAIIQYPFTKRQYKVLLHILRKTYGFKKKTDDMTISQIARATGLNRAHASTTVQELKALNTVLIWDGTHGYVLGINKNYAKWGAFQNRTCSKTETPPFQNSNLDRSKTEHTKETLTKETTKRNTRGSAPLLSIDEYREQCKQKEQPVIAEDAAVFRYASEAGIPVEYLRLCFREFVERYRDRGKKQRDWPLTFLNCVRARWYKLWWFDADGQCHLTSDGQQAWNKHKEAMRDAA